MALIEHLDQEGWRDHFGMASDWSGHHNVADMDQDLRRIQAGERPFEAWMRERGHSQEHIERVHGLMDQWLHRKGLIRLSSTIH
jgi:hypothetical protein